MTLLLDRDGEIGYIEDFIPAEEADFLLARLLEELDWQAESIRIAGREIQVPRLVCWYGDTQAHYRYSGVDHRPLPWTATLQALRVRVETRCQRRLNSVLCNLYRDGRDSMGWHADNERELGPNPFIASLSLGAERRFDLRHDRTGEILHLPLTHGSLLLMGGSLQHHWRHRIAKQVGIAEPRINLTFRLIHPST
jgi:alkylated DNA repair dioxygenase AlkB